ncbi:hypothetical protein [Infirmifilum uzonense]|uniref:hypothetical protein n=1 Tax=Infirmifilum uzonense TaxID=1550241 RepID=UPI003C74F1A5
MMKKRFTRSLRAFSPRTDDVLVAVTLENLQSLLLLDLLLDIEKEYNVRIHHLHIGESIPREIEERVSRSPIIASTRLIRLKPKNYTDVKLNVVSNLGQYPSDSLYVLPFTADDLACYFLEELLKANLTGLALEAEARTAYPLYTTTNSEVGQVYRGTSLRAATIRDCDLLQALAGRVALQAFGNFYVEAYVKRRGGARVNVEGEFQGRLGAAGRNEDE